MPSFDLRRTSRRDRSVYVLQVRFALEVYPVGYPGRDKKSEKIKDSLNMEYNETHKGRAPKERNVCICAMQPICAACTFYDLLIQL